MAGTLSVYAFICKWLAVEMKERSAAQEHFINLCHVLGEPTPADVDPTGRLGIQFVGGLESAHEVAPDLKRGLQFGGEQGL